MSRDVPKRVLRRLLREATEAMQNVAWPIRVASMQLMAAIEGGGDIREAVRRVREADAKLMAVATDLERMRQGILPTRRDAVAGQLRMAV